jgi:hypothetical protein
MPELYPHFGNSCVVVALQSSGAMPTALTLWTGSAGNIIKFTGFVQGKSKAARTAAETKYKANNDSVHAVKEEIEGTIEGNIYDRSENVAAWFETAVPTFKAAGRNFLFIFNEGVVAAKHKEVYMVGTQSSEVSETDNSPEDCLMLKATSIPPASALALTTTQLAAINTAVGSGTVKGAAATKTIPAAPTVRLVAFTAVA